MRWWEELFPEEERRAYAAMAGDRRFLDGRRPAVLLVDCVRAFFGEPGLSLLESTKTWVTSCGPAAWAALPYLERLLGAARRAGLPVAFTTGQPGADRLFGGTNKAEELAMRSPMALPGAQEIPEPIAPLAGELVLPKPKASAFFATPLLAWLHRQGVDCLLVAGCTTSGCVRATVVDAMSYGFHVGVVEEATFDRSRLSHGVHLFEMNTKYADVLSTDEAVAFLAARGETGRGSRNHHAE
jgi:maleamate amidohydrolase